MEVKAALVYQISESSGHASVQAKRAIKGRRRATRTGGERIRSLRKDRGSRKKERSDQSRRNDRRPVISRASTRRQVPRAPSLELAIQRSTNVTVSNSTSNETSQRRFLKKSVYIYIYLYAFVQRRSAQRRTNGENGCVKGPRRRGRKARLNRDEEGFFVGWRNGAKDFGWVVVGFGTRERGGREKERASGWINVKAYDPNKRIISEIYRAASRVVNSARSGELGRKRRKVIIKRRKGEQVPRVPR